MRTASADGKSSGDLPDGPPHGFGISFSGGGIRSASYSLGVLQEMHEHDMIVGERRARWLSAVSGGSYLAGAIASVARGALDAHDDALPLSFRPASGHGVADGRPFAVGTPEERYLRDHTRYLTHVTGGWAGVVWRMALGITLNVGFIALTLHLVMRPLGWLYGSMIPALRVHTCVPGQVVPGPCLSPSVPWHVHHWGVVLVIAGALAALATFLGLCWAAIRWSTERKRAAFGWASASLMIAAGSLLVAGIGVVAALHVLRTSIGNQVSTVTEGVTRSGVTASSHSVHILGIAVGAGLAGVVTSAYGALRHVLTASSELEQSLWRRVRVPLLNVLATLAGPVLLIVLSLLFLSWGAAAPPFVRNGGSVGELLRWAIPAGVLVAAWWVADLVSWSLHPLYKRALSLAFMQRRVRTPAGGSPTAVGDEDADERPYDRPYPLSDMQPPELPEILICAAANVNDYGATPTGLNATSFVFSSAVIGGSIVGAMGTSEYERSVGWRFTDVTLPAAISIAGAAFGPAMGKMTRAPLRFILALTNLRLGVWIPNPRHLDTFAVSGLRAAYRLRPRPEWLARELFGLNHLDARYLYVTDGGHYENLGLVELLRRKCAWIWAVDAAGDSVDTFSSIGQAMALASAELDITVELDPTVMSPPTNGNGERLVAQPYAVGTIRYPDGGTGRLVLLKAGVSVDAPWGVRAFHRSNPGFPCDPTFDQLYDADRFDAYRELGSFAVRRAWEEVGAEFEKFRKSAGQPASA